MWITIHKRTFLAFIKRQNISGKVKVFWVYEFNGMIDGIEYINKELEINIDTIIKHLEKFDAKIYYDVEKDRIEVICFDCFHYDIIDERFEPLKDLMRKKLIAKRI